jgi:hypothetical protein
MTLHARLARLEGSLPPAPAVLRWLGSAHEFVRIEAYVRSLGDFPDGAESLAQLRKEAADVVRTSMAGLPDTRVQEAVRLAYRDAAFLLELVFTLNISACVLLGSGSLRWSALSSEALARAAEARRPAKGSTEPPPVIWETWSTQADALAVDLLAAAAGRRLLEQRYLAGHQALFPDVFADCVALRREITKLICNVDLLRRLFVLAGDPSAEPTSTPAERLLALRRTASSRAHSDAAALVRNARLSTALQTGDGATATAIFRDRLRSLSRTSADDGDPPRRP